MSPCSIFPSKRSFWTFLLLPLVSLASLVALLSEISCSSVLPHARKPPINTEKFIPSFKNLSALYKEVRTVVQTFGNKLKNRKLYPDKQSGFHRISGLSYAL